MKIIVCLDNKKGMLFQCRRVSRDLEVVKDILSLGETIWMHPYSEKLFSGYGGDQKIDKAFLENVDEGWCFVENQSLLEYKNDINEILVYWWNRNYPSDFFFDLDLEQWTLCETREFVGKSHEKITRERYIRGD